MHRRRKISGFVAKQQPEKQREACVLAEPTPISKTEAEAAQQFARTVVNGPRDTAA